MKRLVLVTALLALPRSLLGCLWDEDTLAAEAKGIPDVVRVITGGFERNPPLYYTMSLENAAARIEANPADLAAYDNAGVSCDRLGQDDEAIDWMERKVQQLDAMERAGSRASSDLDEHRYRYLANVGTFWAHRWLKAGADRSRLNDLKKARDYIAEAIELNPNAHFGRERYQLQALETLLQPPQSINEELPPLLPVFDPTNGNDATVRGLAGLIVLGNAWESVDIFNTLAQALFTNGERASVAMLAILRCDELINTGRRSLLPAAPQGATELKQAVRSGANGGSRGGPVYESDVRAAFHLLRDEAEVWHRARTAFMTARLREGRHPDTDPSFWEGYHDSAPPAIPEPSAMTRAQHSFCKHKSAYLIGSSILVVSVSFAGGMFVERRRWQRLLNRERTVKGLTVET